MNLSKTKIFFSFVLICIFFHFLFLPVLSQVDLKTNNQAMTSILEPLIETESIKLSDPIKLEARIDVPLNLNLEKALKIAFLQNLDIVQSNYNKNLFKWKFFENIGNWLPNYKIGGSDQRFDGLILVGGVFPVNALTSSANAYMRFDYPFFQGGKGLFNTLAAKKLYNSSKEDLSTVEKNIILSVSKTYNNLLKEEAQLDVLLKTVEEAKSELELNQNLESSGVGTRFDVLQSEALFAEQEQKYIAQQSKFREASIELARILNLQQGTHIKPDSADLKPRVLFDINRPISEILKVAFDNRPEIKSAKLQYNAQKNYVAGAYSGFLPQANIYGQYGGAGHVFFHRTKIQGFTPDAIALDGNGNPINQTVVRNRDINQTFSSQVDLTNITNVSNVIHGAGKPFASAVDDSLMVSRFVGVQVDWNFGTGLGVPLISKINQAKNQAKISKVAMEKLNQNVEQEVRASFLNAQTANKLLNVAKKRLEAATEALRLAKIRLENGVGINTELLLSQKQYSEALASNVNAIIDYNNAQADLLHSLGLISIDTLLARNIK